MNVRYEKIKNTQYRDLCGSENVMYCELTNHNHASNFAGIAFEYTDSAEVIVCDFEEQIFSSKNEYDNCRIGVYHEYIDSIIETYRNIRPQKGIKIYFLVYTDIGSSKSIFEKLTETVFELYHA